MGKVLIVFSVFILWFSGYLLIGVLAHGQSKIRIDNMERKLIQADISEGEKKDIMRELNRVHANAITFTVGLEYSFYLFVTCGFALGMAGAKIARQKKQIQLLQANQRIDGNGQQ